MQSLLCFPFLRVASYIHPIPKLPRKRASRRDRLRGVIAPSYSDQWWNLGEMVGSCQVAPSYPLKFRLLSYRVQCRKDWLDHG
jgi:hypothetical protein